MQIKFLSETTFGFQLKWKVLCRECNDRKLLPIQSPLSDNVAHTHCLVINPPLLASVDFITVLLSRFSYYSHFWQLFSSFKPKTQLCNFVYKISYEKRACKTLMKLTPGVTRERPQVELVYFEHSWETGRFQSSLLFCYFRHCCYLKIKEYQASFLSKYCHWKKV